MNRPYDTDSDEKASDLLDVVESPAQTASWYARADEQYDIQWTALAEALSELVNGMKKSLKFRDLQVIESLFYCQLPNKEVARLMSLDEKTVALIKHRNLKHLREHVTLLEGRGLTMSDQPHPLQLNAPE